METDFIDNRELVVKYVPKSRLFTTEKLLSVFSQLDNQDAISLLYLMCDSRSTYHILESCRSCHEFSKFFNVCLDHIVDWQDKIIEALVEIKCFKPLLDVFGVNKMDALFNITGNNHYLNRNKMKIYNICEELDGYRRNEFLKYMKAEHSTNMPIEKFEYLELYFMYWESMSLIVPSSGKGFDSLTNVLGKLGGNLVDIIMPEGYDQPSCSTIDEYTLGTYKILEKEDVGLCVIVNQYDFLDPQNNRDASDRDTKCLEKEMKYLNFRVVILNNLVVSEFVSSIKRAINCEFKKNHSILFLTIMSHGRDNLIMGTDGLYVPLTEITKALFETECLLNVPKVLVVCACRGNSLYTAHNTEFYVADSPLSDEKIKSDIIDLIVCYSTIPGFISLRNKLEGSLFMQVFCEVLRKKPELEICEIFTLVNKALMNPKDFRVYNPAKLAQPCEFSSRLRKKLFLIPKDDE